MTKPRRSKQDKAYEMLARGTAPSEVAKVLKVARRTLNRWILSWEREFILKPVGDAKWARVFTRGPQAWRMDHKLGIAQDRATARATRLQSRIAGGIAPAPESIRQNAESSAPRRAGAFEWSEVSRAPYEPAKVLAHAATYRWPFTDGPTHEPPWAKTWTVPNGSQFREVYAVDTSGVVWRVRETRGSRGAQSLLVGLQGMMRSGYDEVLKTPEVALKAARDFAVQFATRCGYSIPPGEPLSQRQPLEYARGMGREVDRVGVPGVTRTWTDGTPAHAVETSDAQLMAEWERLPETRAKVEALQGDVADLGNLRQMVNEQAEIMETMAKNQTIAIRVMAGLQEVQNLQLRRRANDDPSIG